MFDTILYPLSFRWPQDICVRPCHCVSLRVISCHFVSFRVIYRYAFRVIPCHSVSFQVKGVEFLRFLSKSKHPACTEVEGARLRLDAGSIYICRCRCLHCTRTDCNQRVAWLCMEVRWERRVRFFPKSVGSWRSQHIWAAAVLQVYHVGCHKSIYI